MRIWVGQSCRGTTLKRVHVVATSLWTVAALSSSFANLRHNSLNTAGFPDTIWIFHDKGVHIDVVELWGQHANCCTLCCCSFCYVYCLFYFCVLSYGGVYTRSVARKHWPRCIIIIILIRHHGGIELKNINFLSVYSSAVTFGVKEWRVWLYYWKTKKTSDKYTKSEIFISIRPNVNRLCLVCEMFHINYI